LYLTMKTLIKDGSVVVSIVGWVLITGLLLLITYPELGQWLERLGVN
jgi:hypothetical protein